MAWAHGIHLPNWAICQCQPPAHPHISWPLLYKLPQRHQQCFDKKINNDCLSQSCSKYNMITSSSNLNDTSEVVLRHYSLKKLQWSRIISIETSRNNISRNITKINIGLINQTQSSKCFSSRSIRTKISQNCLFWSMDCLTEYYVQGWK